MTDEPDGVLSPDDLDATDDRLRELDDDRFVVSTDGESDAQTADTDEGPPDPDPAEPPADEPPERGGNPAPLSELDGAFALGGRARLGDEPVPFAVGSNDVAATFGGFVRWYAGAVAPGVPPAEAVAVLLSNSDLDVEVRSR